MSGADPAPWVQLGGVGKAPHLGPQRSHSQGRRGCTPPRRDPWLCQGWAGWLGAWPVCRRETGLRGEESLPTKAARLPCGQSRGRDPGLLVPASAPREASLIPTQSPVSWVRGLLVWPALGCGHLPCTGFLSHVGTALCGGNWFCWGSEGPNCPRSLTDSEPAMLQLRRWEEQPPL